MPLTNVDSRIAVAKLASDEIWNLIKQDVAETVARYGICFVPMEHSGLIDSFLCKNIALDGFIVRKFSVRGVFVK